MLPRVPPIAAAARESEHFGASQKNQFLCASWQVQSKKKKEKQKETHYKKVKNSSYLMALFSLCRVLEGKKTPEFVTLYLVNTGMSCV